MSSREHFEKKISNNRFKTARRLFSGQYDFVLILESWIEDIPSGRLGMFKIRTAQGEVVVLDESRLDSYCL